MARQPMISYAQNGEDVVLERAFADQKAGFWIDIGACDPELDSVTLHLSKRGWRGINVEPDVALYEHIVAARPRDINVRAAIGAVASERLFFPTDTRGHGTLVEGIARDRALEGAYSVETMPLSALIEKWVPEGQVIDFLKIDVEGYENEVIASGDWRRHRPRIVIVEAVDDNGNPTHETWESTLLSNGYVRTLFDGLNRWYCRSDEGILIKRTEAPANILDNWLLASHAALKRDAVNRSGVKKKAMKALRAMWR